MNPNPRPLAGCTVNLSISESDDSRARGFPDWQVNRVTLQIVAALFGQGAGVIFGHDWREDGVMEAVHGFAQQMQTPVGDPPPLMRNLLPWPDRPKLAPDDLARLAGTLSVEEAGLPAALAAYREAPPKADSREWKFLRARGLTHLRHRLTELADARLCLGGRTAGAAGRFPGVIEEALLAVQAGQPLYLAGLLGGATGQLIDAIEGGEMPERFCARTAVHELYERPPIPEPGEQRDLETDPRAVWSVFRETATRGVAERNGLTPNENAELFHTPVLDRAIVLVLTGLGRLRQAR